VLPVESPPQEAVIPTDLCPLSVPEVRHLLARLLFPPPSSPPLVQGAGRRGGAGINTQPAFAIAATVSRRANRLSTVPGISLGVLPGISLGLLPRISLGLGTFGHFRPLTSCFCFWLAFFMRVCIHHDSCAFK
jgi:hypothetical protein